MNELHPIQRSIVELLERLGAGNFNKIKPENVDPHLFVYHLNKLIEEGVIEKNEEGTYQFTPQGKHLLVGLHQSDSFADANTQSYIVLALRKGDLHLAVTRTMVPFLGYCGFLSLHIAKEKSILESVRSYVAENAFEVSDLKMSMIIDTRYKNNTTESIVQHSLVFVVTGELLSNDIPQEISEGRLSLLTGEQLLSVEKGYSNTRDILESKTTNFVYLEREYSDEL